MQSCRIELYRDKHIQFLLKGLDGMKEKNNNKKDMIFQNDDEALFCDGAVGLGESYSTLDASRPWLCFWGLHALELLRFPITHTIRKR
jgi:hypothetical protein